MSNSSHLLLSESTETVNPVVLPSGRAGFCNKLMVTGSFPAVKTIGMVFVCSCTAVVAGWLVVTITSGARLTSSTA